MALDKLAFIMSLLNNSSGESQCTKEQIKFGSALEFPTIGEPNRLYIATDRLLAYIWDEKTQTYVNINESGMDINTIQSIL